MNETPTPETPVFIARHGGQCPDCNLPVRPGERVRKWTDQRYYHEECSP